MKLALKRKFGFVHVRGGNVVTVTHDHQIPIGTESALEDKKHARKWNGEKWVTAKAGDLAIELVAVATGKLLGYSYLSGDAIRLNLYRADVGHWFTGAKVYRANVDGVFSPEMTAEYFIAGLMRCKYADAQVVVLRLVVPSKGDAEAAVDTFLQGYNYIPADTTNDQEAASPTHLLAHIEGKKPAWNALLHFQPPKDAQQYAATGFQIELVHGSPACEPFDPWTTDEPPGGFRSGEPLEIESVRIEPRP